MGTKQKLLNAINFKENKFSKYSVRIKDQFKIHIHCFDMERF